MPFWTCQLAHVCRRSCQRKCSIPARFNAEYQAFVLTCLIELPLKLNTCARLVAHVRDVVRDAGRYEKKRTGCGLIALATNPPLAAAFEHVKRFLLHAVNMLAGVKAGRDRLRTCG